MLVLTEAGDVNSSHILMSNYSVIISPDTTY